METRAQLLQTMHYCFYNNYYKGLDPFGLSSYLYSFVVFKELNKAKEKIQTFIDHATSDSLVQHFKTALQKCDNELTDDTLQKDSR